MSGAPPLGINVNLTAVPETMLWTLHNRVSQASLPNGIIKDPKAVEIYKSIDYDYEKSFGPAKNTHAIRSHLFDKAITEFWDKHPGATVVNLGEGLETQRFRLADEKKGALWVTVDLPSAIAVREKFISPDKDHLHVAVSATELDAWAKQVPTDKPLFITAQGLFMYFKEEEVKSLFQQFAKRFPGSTMMFDCISKWLSEKTMSEKGWNRTEYYTTPRMPFGANRFEAPALFRSWVDGLEVTEVEWPVRQRSGIWGYLSPVLDIIPIIRNYVPGTVFCVKFPTTN